MVSLTGGISAGWLAKHLLVIPVDGSGSEALEPILTKTMTTTQPLLPEGGSGAIL